MLNLYLTLLTSGIFGIFFDFRQPNCSDQLLSSHISFEELNLHPHEIKTIAFPFRRGSIPRT